MDQSIRTTEVKPNDQKKVQRERPESDETNGVLQEKFEEDPRVTGDKSQRSKDRRDPSER
jgi:hypothetical protein